jgi:ligand-binding SRPBCC domain-containing protein
MQETTSIREAGGAEFRQKDATTWTLRAVQRVGVPRGELFPFFADAGNLARLTPPELGFDILTPQPIAMRAGTLIDYRIRLWGIPMSWRTEITTWKPPIEFIDTQLQGPYAEWVHRHRFIAVTEDSTLVEDYVQFQLPMGRLGAIAAPIVRRQLRRIFDYRRGAIARLNHGPVVGNRE